MMLSEVASIMLHGPQPAYFWKNNDRPAQHFQKTLKQIGAWRRRDGEAFRSIETIFFYIYTQHAKQQAAKEVIKKEFVPVDQINKEVDDDFFKIDVTSDFFGIDKEKARNKRLGIAGLNENEEEEER